MHVLRTMVEAVKPGGLVLDLQVIRPNPTVETDAQFVCEIDGEPLFRRADAATAAIDALTQTNELVEQAVDDHDVCNHYANGKNSSTTSSASNDGSPNTRCRNYARSRNHAWYGSAAGCDDSRCADLDER